MNTLVKKVIGPAIVLSAAVAAPAAAQRTTAPVVLSLPATGTFAKGGDFRGTISINRFEQRGNHIVAIGFVAGVLTGRGSREGGTAVAGEVTWPVRVSSGGVSLASDRAPATAGLTRVAWSPVVRPAARYFRVQAQSCPVLNVALAPVNVDLLGSQVALGAVTFGLSGETGTPLGDLICAASDLLGNVAGVVNVLNSLLGLLTGLLGGLTGGL